MKCDDDDDDDDDGGDDDILELGLDLDVSFSSSLVWKARPNTLALGQDDDMSWMRQDDVNEQVYLCLCGCEGANLFVSLRM